MLKKSSCASAKRVPTAAPSLWMRHLAAAFPRREPAPVSLAEPGLSATLPQKIYVNLGNPRIKCFAGDFRLNSCGVIFADCTLPNSFSDALLEKLRRANIISIIRLVYSNLSEVHYIILFTSYPPLSKFSVKLCPLANPRLSTAV